MNLTPVIILAFSLILGACSGGSESQESSITTAAQGPQTVPIGWNLERKNPTEIGVEAPRVEAVLDHVFTDEAVQAAVLSKRGYVIGERYAEGFDKQSRGTSWSVAKSFYGSLIGIAISEGWLKSTEQKASEIITEWANGDKAGITIGHILSMRSGYDPNDQVFFQNDQSAYSIGLALTSVPNEAFAYSNANSQLMEPLIRRATGVSAHDYLTSKILEPLGIDNPGLWLDSTGEQPMTYCCIDLVPDDFLRFGILFSRRGEWDGDQLIPREFVDDSLTAHSSYYGYQWWLLNEAFFGSAVPIETFAALGLNGQKIYIWPETDIALVVLTQYQHSENQGYILDLLGADANFPDTCTSRNSCPESRGNEVPAFDEQGLIELISAIAG